MAMGMNRPNSFSLKWWPGHSNNNNNQANDGGGGGGSSGGGGGGVAIGNGAVVSSSFANMMRNSGIVLPQQQQQQLLQQQHPPQLPHPRSSTFGSSIAVQKLRESKWFQREEQRIFCAVVECGFIVEVRNITTARNYIKRNNSYDNDDDDDDDDDDYLQDENETPMTSWFGIVLCKTAKDNNKPKAETIEIYTVKIRPNGSFKMLKLTLDDIWNSDCELKINNFADKECKAHNEKDIRNQVSFARKAKQSLWNNNKHFAYWCRYGSRQQDVRKRQMSECVKWGSVGMNAGMLLLMNKQKSYSTSK